MGKIASDPRQRLLDAGLKQFANRGYAGTSVQDITEDAKVTKPTLYYYFQSKEGLFQALVDQAMDERLELIRQAAPPDMPTVDQLTAIMVAVTEFAKRQPDLLRLCFSIAFAAPGEFPTGFKKHHKILESLMFVSEIIRIGLERGDLNPSFTVDELTQTYFHLIQHSTVLAVFESKFKKTGLPPELRVSQGTSPGLPPRMEPKRIVELFLTGSANRDAAKANGVHSKRASGLAQVTAILMGLGLSILGVHGQTTTNVPPTVMVPVATTNAAPTIAGTVTTTTTTATDTATTNAAPIISMPAVTNQAPPPDMADVRPIPSAVRASHPELATVSPVLQNAKDPHALDLQTCFQLTAVRDDSLKISMQDIYIAQAQLSQSIAGLWPTFTGSNQQEFLHYRSAANNSINVLGGSLVQGNINYTSQSNISMNYTILNGGQNWNAVGASAAAVAAKKQTLARNYQTIYQDVAQAFYDVLQYQGDMVIQSDLIDALQARVDDLRDRVKLGRSRPSELLQAQTDCANAKVTYEKQRGSLNAAKETLAFYIGIPSSYFVLKESQKFPNAAQLEGYVQHSMNRPDVLSQLESLRQAERNLSVAQGQLWPTVAATGNYLASQDPVSNQVDATMTIEISMPIFDGGMIIGQIHQNKELVRQSRLNVEQLQRTSDEDTRTAYANFNASVAQVVVLREAALLAAKNIEAQVEDYRRGVVSNLDVLTALQDYQSARQGLHDANMAARLNLINLNVAAGTAATGPGANNEALPSAPTIKTAP
jgi:outer membrane protein TolC/AcrR family transcriptional regulator